MCCSSPPIRGLFMRSRIFWRDAWTSHRPENGEIICDHKLMGTLRICYIYISPMRKRINFWNFTLHIYRVNDWGSVQVSKDDWGKWQYRTWSRKLVKCSPPFIASRRDLWSVHVYRFEERARAWAPVAAWLPEWLLYLRLTLIWGRVLNSGTKTGIKLLQSLFP
jgi:hypothetical protein